MTGAKKSGSAKGNKTGQGKGPGRSFVGARLRQLRKERDISQAQLAATLGLSASYVNQIEHDQRPLTLAVLEKMRASGKLEGANEYQVLFTTYAGLDGREKDVIAVINEGVEKGILKPDYNTYVALAQAYYYSDQPAQAITAYQTAAPLAKDGETYLNMAKVLHQENRIGEAKAAARQALAKGVKKEKDANAIIALPGN